MSRLSLLTTLSGGLLRPSVLMPIQLARTLWGLDPGLVVDVGANTGQFGSICRRVGWRGRIHSFEPIPDVFQALESRSRDDGLWEVSQFAVGDSSGAEAMIRRSHSEFTSFLPTSDYGRQVGRQFSDSAGAEVSFEEREVVPVQVVRLDEAVSPTAKRIFLKSDTQGFDLKVLEGASGMIDRVIGVQVELSAKPVYEGAPTYLDMLAYLEGRGFMPANLVPVAFDRDGHAIEFDLFAHRVGEFRTPLGPMSRLRRRFRKASR